MQSAAMLIEHVRNQSVEIFPDEDKIICRPARILSTSDLELLRRNKMPILAALYKERYEAGVLTAMEPSDRRIRNLHKEVVQKGYVLIWSCLLQELIAFCPSTEDVAKVPRGLVAYTVDELAMLFPETTERLSENSLKLIHKAKALGNGTIESVVEDQTRKQRGRA